MKIEISNAEAWSLLGYVVGYGSWVRWASQGFVAFLIALGKFIKIDSAPLCVSTKTPKTQGELFSLPKTTPEHATLQSSRPLPLQLCVHRVPLALEAESDKTTALE